MQMGEDLNISDAEWKVMEALWAIRGGTAAQVISQLAVSTEWNHRTIRTLLRRLVEKGFVQRIEQAGGSAYAATARRRDCVRKEGKSFMERVFSGDPNSLLLHFAREAKLTPKKLQQLRQLLDDEQEATNG